MKNVETYYLYCVEAGNNILKSTEIDGGLYYKEWRPSLLCMKPKGLNKKLYVLWLIYFTKIMLRRFAYTIYVVYHNEKPIHYTVLSTKCFRFPFMRDEDIQIGPSWTKEDYRRKGIASSIILNAIRQYSKEGRRFYWIAREMNEPSRKLVEKLGFRNMGVIRRNSLLGILHVYKKGDEGQYGRY